MAGTESAWLTMKTGQSVLTSVLVLLLTLLVYKVVSFVYYVIRLNQTFHGAPSPANRHWLYGHMHMITSKKRSHDRLMQGVAWCRQFPRYYIFWNGPAKASITVTHPESVRAVMKTSEPKPTGFGGIYRFALPWLGEGLLIAGGSRWARSRRLLTPAFHFDILKPYVQVYNKAVETMMANLEQFAEINQPFETFRYVCPCTLDIILRCAFSYQTDCQNLKSATHPYVQAVTEIAETWSHRARTIYLYPDWIFYLTQRGRRFLKNCDYVHQVAEDIIRSRRHALESTKSSEPKEGKRYLDFLDILLKAKDESGVGLTELEIRNEVDTFLFEGHDTTASGISWILYDLASHPQYQQRCQDEIDTILEGRDSDTIEWSDLPKLEYLTQCIKEGMRLHSPVPVVQREFTKDFTLDGRSFPKGTTVTLHIFGLHRNPAVWDEPDKYDPARFSKENVAKMDSYQFVPFSAGPRNCIGQNFALNEEKVVIARLLRRFTFRTDPDHSVLEKVSAVTRSEDGIMLYAKRR